MFDWIFMRNRLYNFDEEFDIGRECRDACIACLFKNETLSLSPFERHAVANYSRDSDSSSGEFVFLSLSTSATMSSPSSILMDTRRGEIFDFTDFDFATDCHGQTVEFRLYRGEARESALAHP